MIDGASVSYSIRVTGARACVGVFFFGDFQNTTTARRTSNRRVFIRSRSVLHAVTAVGLGTRQRRFASPTALFVYSTSAHSPRSSVSSWGYGQVSGQSECPGIWPCVVRGCLWSYNTEKSRSRACACRRGFLRTRADFDPRAIVNTYNLYMCKRVCVTSNIHTRV